MQSGLAVERSLTRLLNQAPTRLPTHSLSDLRVAANCAHAILKHNNDEMKWPLFHGMIENALYGGRISDPYDNRVLKAYVASCLAYVHDAHAPSHEHKYLVMDVWKGAYICTYVRPLTRNPDDQKLVYTDTHPCISART